MQIFCYFIANIFSKLCFSTGSSPLLSSDVDVEVYKDEICNAKEPSLHIQMIILFANLWSALIWQAITGYLRFSLSSELVV